MSDDREEFRLIRQQRPARKKRRTTTNALDAVRRDKDPYNPFSLKIARAKVMIERGESVRTIQRALGLSEWTITRLRRGVYDAKIPAAFIEQARATESSKLTLIAGKIADSILEDDEVLEQATLQQRMTALGIAIDKRELLEGRPTARVDHLIGLSDSELEQEIERKMRELRQSAKARGMTVDAEWEEVSEETPSL